MKNFNALLLLFVALFCTVTFTSCLGDDEDDEKSCYDELQRLSQIANEKAQALSTNMTTANCNAFKEAAINFYNKAKECGDKNMIESAERSKAMTEALDCSDL
ncbi:hypothetical protein H7F15_15305 [Pontibacter sp. Tf4]|uniref:hypothetical protein n=1 Tax=Pontibacter sp. Tf4 TaxID=2761620 RepID=UPI0016291F95|nr:hypothetical protein [Pontibacter sp. Tf4]MBB6612413.1 hypothetical protein [Pontibacter sp. Tf4]